MGSTDDLVPVLKRLKLSGVLETLELRTRQAIDESLAFPEFLFRLLQDEVERREAKQLHQRIKRANFEQTRTLEEFDFTFNPMVPRAPIIELATCRFVERHVNVLLIGPAGVGKSHIAQALGHRACQAGFTTQFSPAHQLLSELRAARADQSWERRMARLVALDLLIVDDVGLRPLAADEPIDLYELIRRRYERGSTVFTSNRAVDEWYPLFGDALLASAAMDRLLHHSEVLTLEGESYRNPPKKKQRSGAGRSA